MFRSLDANPALGDPDGWRAVRAQQVRARQLFHCYLSGADIDDDPYEEADDAYLAYYDEAAAEQ